MAAPQIGVKYSATADRWRDSVDLLIRALPWQIYGIRIVFGVDGPATVAEADIEVIDSITEAPVAFSSFVWDDTNKIATLTPTTPIMRAVLNFRILNHPTLDMWCRYVRILYGDTYGDGIVNVKDTHVLRGMNGNPATPESSYAFGDIDGSGAVNLIDSLLQRGQYGNSILDYPIPSQFFQWMKDQTQ